MEKRFNLVFDDVIKKQLIKAAKDGNIKQILSGWFDDLEENGAEYGELVDSKLFIYELKAKSPPLRLYFSPSAASNEIKVFEFEMKTSPKKQQKTINKLRMKLRRERSES